MNLLHCILHLPLALLSIALIYATAAPLLLSDAWWIRVFDFPRLQICALLIITLILYAVIGFTTRLHPWEYPLVVMATVGLLWQIYCIVPYTPLYPKEMQDSRSEDDSNRISIFIYNVLHDNRKVDALRELIRGCNPDIIHLSEPTHWWLKQLDGLENDYPYTMFQPQENYYGKLVYSKLELINPEFRFLVEPKIPSFRSGVRLRSGKVITLYGLHPRPPGLKRRDAQKEDEREDSDKRDAELLVVAKEIRQLGNTPVIAAGDFNDVAWSRSTRLFQRIGGMLDPRIGRRILNTFDTRSRIMRYPLDHVFTSGHFRLIDIRRLPNIGSDHFPVLVTLDYDPTAPADQQEPTPDSTDEKEARKAIDKGR